MYYNGGYIYLPKDISVYIYRHMFNPEPVTETKDGYYNTLKEVLYSKKPIVAEFLYNGIYTIGYITGTLSEDGAIKLGITTQVFSGSTFSTVSVGVVVTNNDSITISRKIIGG